MRYLIASGKHEIYREGNHTVKTFPKGFPKSEVLREALHISLVEGLGLHVPELYSVGVTEDGCWAITYEFIEGRTLSQLLDEDPSQMEACMVKEEEGLDKEKVLQVFMKGYKLHGKVLRSAKVVVGKPKRN